MKVWVITISHESGIDTFAAKTEKRAYECIYDYVKNYWSYEYNEVMPEDPQEAIRAYFNGDAILNKGEEANVTEVTVL